MISLRESWRNWMRERKRLRVKWISNRHLLNSILPVLRSSRSKLVKKLLIIREPLCREIKTLGLRLKIYNSS
jgi:hypothetical protein